MQLSVSDAARLYGKPRKSMYRHMDAGRLSYHVLGDGRRIIDLSELIRVYGEPPGGRHGNDTPSEGGGDTHGESVLLRAMLEELQGLRREVAELKQQMRLLPAPDAGQGEARKPVSTDTGEEGGSCELVAGNVRNLDDVLARLKSRTGQR